MEAAEARAAAGRTPSRPRQWAARQQNRKEKKMKGGAWSPGLSRICERAFGRPLDKGNQCSNWERRPLRAEQVLYAAGDAVVLARLHDLAVSRLREEGGHGGRVVGTDSSEEIVVMAPEHPQRQIRKNAAQRLNREDFAALVREKFEGLMQGGNIQPNDAAAEALRQVRQQVSGGT